jgi:hypothetical protein
MKLTRSPAARQLHAGALPLGEDGQRHRGRPLGALRRWHAREQEVGGSGGSPESPGPLLWGRTPGVLSALPTMLNPLAERRSLSQAATGGVTPSRSSTRRRGAGRSPRATSPVRGLGGVTPRTSCTCSEAQREGRDRSLEVGGQGSGPAPLRLRALGHLHSKSVLCGGFAWARGALNGAQRPPPPPWQWVARW